MLVTDEDVGYFAKLSSRSNCIACKGKAVTVMRVLEAAREPLTIDKRVRLVIAALARLGHLSSSDGGQTVSLRDGAQRPSGAIPATMCKWIVTGARRATLVNCAMVNKSAPELFLVQFTRHYPLFGVKLGPSRR